MKIKLDFSKVPSDVALLVAQNETTDELAAVLVRSMGLTDEADRQMFHDELIGHVAALVDRYTGNR